MVGGGGDTTPLNGGEFLLQLLRNPPQHLPPSLPHQQPSQALPQDPAVAAVGPTLPPFPPFESNGQDLPYRPPWAHNPPPFAPHNYFNHQGFPQNPNHPSNPNPNTNPNLNPNWSSSPPGFDYKQNLIGQKLIFGSLSSEVRNLDGMSNGHLDYNNLVSAAKAESLLLKEREKEMGLRNRTALNGMEVVDFQNYPELRRNPQVNLQKQQQHSGNYRSMEVPQRVSTLPPGFSSNSRSVGKKIFEQDVDEGKGKSSQLHYRSVGSFNGNERERVNFGSNGRGFGGQLDDPGPSRGSTSNLHSVLASDIEESIMELHGVDGKKTRDQGLDKRVSDDLEEYVDSLVLEDGVDEKNDKKQHSKSRDKDYRSDKRGKWLLNQRMRNYKRQTECRIDINRLNASFLAIYESLIPAEEEKTKQKQLLTLLEKHVTKEWPGARLHLYGSCANSFGFRKSDIDVCLAIEDAEVNKSEVLLKLADILQSDNLENVQALTRARVPIVKLMDPATGISCDICVNNLLAVINTKLLRDYAKIDVRLQQLAFIVKHWAKSRGVNETYRGTLSSYAYVLMCIHFLQQRVPSILPCLQGMETTFAVTVDDVECAYFDQMEKLHGFGSRNGESIAQLVWAFFNYWAYCHDYANDVISVRTGSTLSKRAKDWTRRIGNDRHLICIEDPFEVSHDLGRVVDRHSIRVLREEFERAAEIMQYDSDPCVKLFQRYIPS